MNNSSTPPPQQGTKRRPVRAGQAPSGQKMAPDSMASANDENSGPLGRIVIRNEFYRDGYRSMQKIAILQAFVILGLIVAILVFFNTHRPENRYFATTEDGRLVQMVALSEPNLSVPALMSWTAQSATEVMSFSFVDYKRRLQEASRNFTRKGWESFTTALQNSRFIETVEANQYVVTAVPRSAPILVEEGLVLGRYQWVVELPMTFTFQAGSKTQSSQQLVRITIVRVSKLESPNGIGIEQWIATAGGN